jgi:hypothetical protein
MPNAINDLTTSQLPFEYQLSHPEMADAGRELTTLQQGKER